MINLNIHEDLLQSLNQNFSLNQKLGIIHQAVRNYFDFIQRIAVALYEDHSDIIKTFLASCDRSNPLIHYESKLADAHSLKKISEDCLPRVVNDLSIFDAGEHEHTLKIKAEGYQASYTLPIFNDEKCFGFIFFNSSQKDCFNKEVLDLLDVFGHLITNVIKNELNAIKTMLAAFRTANQMVHLKDPETGSHLERMAHFSRLIANELSLSDKYDFNDEYIEDIFIFSPMHDIGKIGIPDQVLSKPAKLNKAEWQTMQTHAYKGRMVINAIIENFDFESMANINVLRNIAEYHHEALNGNGYPNGIKGEQIPIEARIVAVADIFDALTNERPYKKAWSNEKAFKTLRKLADDVLDQDCVNALTSNETKILEIQNTFCN